MAPNATAEPTAALQSHAARVLQRLTMAGGNRRRPPARPDEPVPAQTDWQTELLQRGRPDEGPGGPVRTERADDAQALQGGEVAGRERATAQAGCWRILAAAEASSA
jgi:hypothetical protein